MQSERRIRPGLRRFVVFAVVIIAPGLDRTSRMWVLERVVGLGIVVFFPLTPWLLNRLFRVRSGVSPGSGP